ncbi:MAG: hypothetical protein ACI83P_001303 [Janthinobacterium sp.]|jgi:hypothetical protein
MVFGIMAGRSVQYHGRRSATHCKLLCAARIKEKMTSFVKSLVLGAALSWPLFGHAQTAPSASTKVVMVVNPMAASGTAPAPAGKASGAASKVSAAPGSEDNGKVWVNTASKVYHCAGTRYYGKTKAGRYMTQTDAKAEGNRASNEQACS